MRFRVDIDYGLPERDRRPVTDRVHFFAADTWAEALALISPWISALDPPPFNVDIIMHEDRWAEAWGEALGEPR